MNDKSESKTTIEDDAEALDLAKHQAHERECESAAMAYLREQEKIRRLRIFPIA